ncbi:MAG TPA: hypothetical protein ENN19_14190 [Chloroflexi bacterium]|nr:hypothetical protein [Chloroflexota bacterium]
MRDDVTLEAIRFIGQPVTVAFDRPPAYEKKPGCPDRFDWRGETYHVHELLGEWHNYERRGRMANNMRPSHAVRASRTGSWGVGRYYFRVRTDTGRIFELYYDRASTSVDDRKGAWCLYRELSSSQD